MRKQTKLALGLSAAALLAVGASMTSFAARGWVAEGDQWYYYDNSGDYVTDKWKSYNGNYFYLGSDGYMLTNELIEDGNNWYYVDANGAMVKNTWVAVPVDDTDSDLDVDYRWYYFGANGKAYKDSDKKTINGKKYGFDDEGKMLFGFVDSGRNLLTDVDDAVLNALRYYGSNDDGAMYTGWLLYQDAIDAEGYDDQYYWFYFKSNGKKVSDGTEKIKGKTYAFDTYGVMKYGWDRESTVGGAVTAGYFADADNGSLQKDRWVWSDGKDGLTGDLQIIGNNDDDHWYYVKKNGQAYYDMAKKINGKWYVFDEAGQMNWGLVYLTTKSVKTEGAKILEYPGTGEDPWDPENINAQDLYDYNGAGYLHYFSNDEEKDGSMKTGTSVKIELQDDTYTFGFDKTSGAAYEGIEKNKLYWNGVLQEASDYKYEVRSFITSTGDIAYCLISSNGTRMKATSRTYKDSDDNYYYVVEGSDAKGYTIYKAGTAADAKKQQNGEYVAEML